MIAWTPLTRMRFAGKLCMHGAWIFALAGLTPTIFIIINQFSNFQANNGQNVSDEFVSIAIALILIVIVCFISLVLFAFGAYLGYLSAADSPQAQEVNDEMAEITPLPKMQ